VSAQADHEPTDDEWRETLAEQGFSSEKIEEIIEESSEA
jgi:SOS response regulatory protein OraA/RecX